MAFDSIPLDRLAKRAYITEIEIVRLGDALRNDGPVSFAEALALTAIECSATVEKHVRWRSFYVDAMLAFALADTAPEGYVDLAKADRLIALVAPSGRIATAGALEMLTTVMAHARWVPERLTALVLDEILCAVASGEGVMRGSDQAIPSAAIKPGPGSVTETDVDRIVHVLYGASRDGRRLSRLEINALLSIDAAAEAERSHRFDDLFIAGLSDAALQASGYAGPVRETILGPGRVLSLTREAYLSAYRPLSLEERSIEALEWQRIGIITGDEPSSVEAHDLADLLARHPDTSAMRGLAAAFAVLGPILHPKLQKHAKDRRAAIKFGIRAA